MNDTKSKLKQQYKDNPPSAGIFKITNKANGKVFIGSGQNIKGILNSQEFQLKCGSHMNPVLQKDWKQYGADNFTFEIIDQLKPSDNPQNNIKDELTELESLWLERLSPFGEKGYNKPPQK